MTKRKHEETERVLSDAELAANLKKDDAQTNYSRRQMQGQGDKPHTIDSDDEEEERARENKFEKLKDDDIEGQQDEDNQTSLRFDDGDGSVPITPFNLKEEQQEGSFSKDGDFVWNKKDDIKDAWLDDIDWVKVKQKSADDLAKQEQEDEDEDEAQEKYSELETYRSISAILKPGESVAKALRRLGGNKKTLSASERWKRKKAGIAEDPEEAKNKELMLKLTGLADSILTRSGAMEIYEETFESISFKLKQEEEKKRGIITKPAEIPEGVDDDDALDMFADNLDSNTESKQESAPEGQSSEAANGGGGASTEKAANGGSESTTTTTTSGISLDDEVMWEFKWKNEEDEEVHGPHSSSKMLEWQDSGFFKDGVWCRKAGTTGDFSNSKRIDFDLYT